MWQRIKDFFQSTWSKAALIVGVIGGAVGLRMYTANDTTPPSPEALASQRDYRTQLQRLDPTRPVGVFLFNVPQDSALAAFGARTGLSADIVNASRNNFIQEMRRYYGDNFVVVDNASPEQLRDFSRQFNEHFRGSPPCGAHFVVNHHQGTYNDAELASILQSFQAGEKRAMILACGPNPQAYQVPGFNYVIIPRPNGEILGPEISLRISPAYREAIGWMHEHADPEQVRERFRNQSPLDTVRDHAMTRLYDIWNGRTSQPHQPPTVVTPPPGLPTLSPIRAPQGR